MPIPLLALAISAFAIGTTEFVIMGLLPEVARDLAVSIPSAGLLVSGYALGVAVGAPLLAVVTSKMPRKLALQLLMGVFIVGNTLCAIASSYSVLMIARVVTSFAHGSFFGIGAVVAASLVPAEKRASAIALMFTGLTLANVLGVPFGTFVGQEFGWRAAFWIVSAFGVLSLAGVSALVPNRHDAGPVGLGHEVRVLKDPQVWTALAMTVLGFGGVFVVFTYIAPILEQVSGFSPRGVTLILVLFGVGSHDRQYGGRQARGPRADAFADGHSGRARGGDGDLRAHQSFAGGGGDHDLRVGHCGVRHGAAVADARGREGRRGAESGLDAEYRRVQRGQCGRRVARRSGDQSRPFARYAAVGRGGGQRGGVAADVVRGAHGCAPAATVAQAGA